jgi:hypothetical protein
MPVSAIAPDAAQSSTSHLSRMPHYPLHPAPVAVPGGDGCNNQLFKAKVSTAATS